MIRSFRSSSRQRRSNLPQEAILAQRCDVCGKGTMSGHSVSHANNKTKRTWSPNLQRVRALVNGQARNVTVCTRCLRSNKLQKAVRGRRRPAEATV